MKRRSHDGDLRNHDANKRRRQTSRDNSNSRRDSRRRKVAKDHRPHDKHHKRSGSSSCSSSSSVNDEYGHYDGNPGDIIKDRYVIRQEVGKGTFGKVFRCKDLKHNDTVALKVVRSVERYIHSAKIEAEICDKVFEKQEKAGVSLCVKMYSDFSYKGHYIMVYEPLGMSLYDLIKKNDYKRFPLDLVRTVALQILKGIDFLESMNLIHTDLKLENVLFVHSTMRSTTVYHRDRAYNVEIPVNPRIKIIDFGGATFDDDPEKSRIVNTRQYRGPEVTLELGWSFPSDVWSTACIIGEIYCGDFMFQTHEELEHVALIEKLCGRFPDYMIRKSKLREDFFHRDGRVRVDALSRDSKKFVDCMPTLEEHFSLTSEDAQSGIIDLMRHLLMIDPQQRWSAKRAMECEFFKDGR